MNDEMNRIDLEDSDCIQCHSPIDLSIDNFTLYQAEHGNHYLYCEKCKSPYLPAMPRYAEVQVQTKNLELHELAITLVVGILIGYIIG